MRPLPRCWSRPAPPGVVQHLDNPLCIGPVGCSIMYMNTYRISFDTHMGRFHYDVPESEVLSKVNAIMALPGPHNVEVTMKESE